MMSLFLTCLTRVIAAAFIRGRRLFHSATLPVRRLFEGGVYSRAAFNRVNTVCAVTNLILIRVIIGNLLKVVHVRS